MATLVGPEVEFIAGQKYFSWEVTLASGDSTNNYTITDFPVFSTLTLFEAAVTSGSGRTIQPELWTDLSDAFLGCVVKTCDASGAPIRNQENVRIVAKNAQLTIKPNVSSAGDHKYRVTVVIGHW